MQFAEITRLTSLQGNCLSAVFSPEGERIAFSCIVGGSLDIYLMDRDGAQLTRLTDGERGKRSYFDPHFHPDGTHLVCVCAEGVDEEDTNLYLIDLHTREGRPLTDTHSESSPTFSPDGQYILYVSTRNTLQDRCTVPEIFQMTWEGREQTRLTHTEFEERGDLAWAPRNLHPRYSPNGSYIAFASSVHGARGENRFEIYRMRPDGSEQTRLSHTQGSSSYPLWHPASRQIAFTSWVTDMYTRKNSAALYLIDVEGSELRCLEESPSINWMHSFSPDGRLLAFDSSRNEATLKVPNNWDLFLLEMQTRQVHTMTDNAVLDKKPIFSPDGKGILFESRRDGADELYYATIQF